MIERILDDATAKAHAEASEWQECADRLNSIAEPTPITTLRGSGWLMTAMPNEAESILAGFAAAQSAAAVDGSPLAAYLHRIQRINALLDTSGIDWSTASLQALLPVVASVAGWSAELLAKVVAIGLPTLVVTSQECQDAWAQYLLDSALSEVQRKANAAIAQATLAYDADGATAQSITAAGAAGWGS